MLRPPIPADPLELVTGAALNVQTPEQRLAAKTLLDNARKLSNVRAQPYDLKTSFITSGSLPSDGSWTMEDISPGARIYRWSAQGPNYSALNLYPDSTQGMAYSNQPSSVIPLRLSQVREAIFFVDPPMGPMASIRVASGYLNGAQQNCVLTMTGARVMNPASRMRSLAPLGRIAGQSGNPVVQVVVLHGNLSPDNRLSETEILASSDSTLNQTALDRANQWSSGGRGGRTQPGATAQSQEMLFTFEFLTYPR